MAAVRQREHVLVVDDEPQILTAVADALEDDFEVVVTTSPQRAIEVAGTDHELAVVISDQRMPSMPGDEMLRRLRQVSSASTMLLTGQADLAAVTRAINDGSIMAFVTKPWSNPELRTRVRQAAAQFRLRRELEAERQLVLDLMTSTSDAIYFADSDQRFTRVNDALVRLVGLTDPSEMLGRGKDEVHGTGGAAALLKLHPRDGQPRRDVIHEIMSVEGHRWLSTTLSPTRDASGEPSGLVSISRDITDRVKTEAALRISEERLRLAFQASKAGLFDWDMKTGEVAYSSRDLPLAGNVALVDGSENLGQRIHPEDLPKLNAAIQAHLETRKPFESLQVRSQIVEDAPYRWHEVNAQAAWDDAGQATRLVGSFLDIEDQGQPQQQRQATPPLEEVERLAENVAHELEVLDALLKSNKTESLVRQAGPSLQDSLDGLSQIRRLLRALKG